jgi:hypothetical protein
VRYEERNPEMNKKKRRFRGILSSDWSECLSPSGPFDFLAFNFPQLSADLKEVFRRYTGNLIALGEACLRIKQILPEPVTIKMMDAYLARSFAVYPGVPELIEWCLQKDILFMLNTTGMIGYFQRVFARRLLPQIPVLSANPMFRYPPSATDPGTILELRETHDKGRNTAAMAVGLEVPKDKVIVMGDSGGDGAHFDWAYRNGAFIIGSMTKHSLAAYCAQRGITINLSFGLIYGPGAQRDPEKEMTIDFRDLIGPIAELFREGS